MYISLEALGSIAIHIALLLACIGYAAFLAQPHIYKAYHPHNTIWTVVGGEMLVGIALGLECFVAGAWIQAQPLASAAFFLTLHIAAFWPIWRWQRKQAEEEKARERAVEARLAAEEREYGN